MNLIRRFTVAAVLAAVTTVFVGAEHLVIITANDTHSTILPDVDGKGGLMRRKVVMDSIRAAEKNVMAVHAGDAVQGTLFFSMFKGDVEYAAMDSLGYDVIIMGNHEFDNSIQNTAEYYRKIQKAEKLSANYVFGPESKAEGIFKPYTIKTVGGKNVAFVGINLNPKGMISDHTSRGVKYYNGIDVALSVSKYLKETGLADYVVLVTHVGYAGMDVGEPTDVILAQRSKYIDIIIGGHSHTTVVDAPDAKSPARVKNADGKDVLITQNGRGGRLLGKIDLDLETGELKYSHIEIDARLDARAAQYTAMNAWLAPYKKKVDDLMNTPVGEAACDMGNPKMGNWLSDAVLVIAQKISGKKADFAIMNAGGIRQPMNKGAISEGLISSMFPFDNRIEILKIKGSDLLDAFKAMAMRGGDLVSQEVAIKFKKGGEIVSAKVNGKDVKADKIYYVATIDYLANGGDYMYPLKRAEKVFSDGTPYGKYILQYIKDLTAKGQKVDASDVRRMVRVE